MDTVQLCEIGMLAVFGCLWIYCIINSWRSRTVKGKSVLFEYIFLVGYLAGLLGKIFLWRRTGELQYSTWLYIAEIIMVLVDIILYYRNKALDEKSGSNTTGF